MNARCGVSWIQTLGLWLAVVVTSCAWADKDEVNPKLFPPAELSEGKANVVYNRYWDEDGRWITEGLQNGQLCISAYEVENHIFRLVDQQIRELGPRPLGSRGSDAQRKVFERCAPGVTLIQRSGAIGTGIIISEDGLILTNRHVVLNAPYVAVSFYEMKSEDGNPLVFRGEVVAADKVRDLALVRVDDPPQNLHVFELDAAVGVQVGDELIAIGHPLGLVWTPTQGSASRVRDDFSWEYQLTNNKAKVIQFQTPISPGNSGGPLLTKDGKLVGVNSFGQGGGQNLNFAVHVEEIVEFVSNNKNYPAANIHDWLTLTEEIRSRLPIPPQMFAQQCDFENDGVIDLVRVDQDNNNQWDTMFMDVDRDANFEFVSLDRDEDSYFEVLLLDRDLDQKPDYVFHGNPELRIPVAVEFVAR